MSVVATLLGPPRFVVDAERFEPAPIKSSALLLYLACADGWVPRSDLTYLLWPDASEPRARGNLRQMVFGFADVPYASDIERERSRIRWRVESDLERFRSALETSDRALAVDTYGGPLLDGFQLRGAPEFNDWLELERDELHRAWRHASLECARDLAAEARPDVAAELSGRVAAADPLDEAALCLWVEALAAAGRRAEAIERCRAFTDRLHSELGVEPAPETRALAARLRDSGAWEPNFRRARRPTVSI